MNDAHSYIDTFKHRFRPETLIHDEKDKFEKFCQYLHNIIPEIIKIQLVANFLNQPAQSFILENIIIFERSLDDLGNVIEDRRNFFESIDRIKNLDTLGNIVRQVPIALPAARAGVASQSEYSEFQTRLIVSVTKGAQNDLVEAIEYIKSKKSEADQLLAAVRKSVNVLQDAQNTSTFATSSEKLAAKAVLWLVGTVVVTLLTAAWSVYLFWYHPPDMKGDLTNIVTILPSVLIVTLFIFAIRFCSRNYRDYYERAQEDLNKSNAFSSLDVYLMAFQDASKRDETRMQVIKELLLRQHDADHTENPSSSLLNLNFKKE